MAHEGIVLLKNERNLLPLENEFLKSIAVIGPNADDVAAQLGDYVPRRITSPIVTVLEGIKRKVGMKTKVFYAKGCSAIGDREAVNQSTAAKQLEEAREAAGKAEVAVVVLGEDAKGNGEGRDVASLDLPGLQEDLIRAVQATGTPTIVVLINGRPLSIRWPAAHVPAIVEAWRPGEEGGTAVADVLFGDYNPSGRLSITVPRHVGQLPMYYNYSASKAMWKSVRGYVDMDASPLWEFGFGLSYTKFEYSDLRVQPAEIRPTDSVHVRVRVKNTGESQGQEVVQLYLHDVLASVTRPVKALKGFQKISLEQDESKEVEFVITPEDMSLLDRSLKRVVEPGQFEVMVGSSSEAIHARAHFEVK